MSAKFADYNRWSTSLKTLMARLDDLSGVYGHKLCLTIATNHESPQIHLYGDKELVRSIVRSDLLEQMQLSDDNNTIIQCPLTGDMEGDIDPNDATKPSMNKRRGVVDCLEIETFPTKFVFKKGAPPPWWPVNVVFGSFHKGRNATEKGEVSADMKSVLDSYREFSKKRAEAIEHLNWDTALPMMKRLRLKEISYGEGKAALSTIVKSRDEPEAVPPTEPTLDDGPEREVRSTEDVQIREFEDGMGEIREEEEAIGHEKMGSLLVESGEVNGDQENIAIAERKEAEGASGRTMRGNGRSVLRGMGRGGVRGTRGRGGGAGGIRRDIVEGTGEEREEMQWGRGNAMMEEMDSVWNTNDEGRAMRRDGHRDEIEGGVGLRMEDHGMNGMNEGRGKKRAAMDDYGMEEEDMKEMEVTFDMDGVRRGRGRGSASTRGGRGRGGAMNGGRGGMIAMMGGGYEMEERGEKRNGRMEEWNMMSNEGGVVRGRNEIGMERVGVGKPGQREESTYQRLMKRFDLDDPKPVVPRLPKIPTLSPSINEITLNLTFVGYYNTMITLSTKPDCTLSFNLHNLPSFPMKMGLKFRAKTHTGKLISTSIPISAWATESVHDLIIEYYRA